MQKLMQLKNKKGFTLIEMLIVILIVVILIAIAVPAVNSYRENATETADEGAAKTLYTAAEAVLTEIEYISATEVFMSPYTDPDDATRNLLATNQVMDPAGGYGTPLMGGILSAIGGTEFPGKFKFGYDIDDNSIIWVSYHDNDNSLNGGRTAHTHRVYVYDVENGISGYADELGAPYNASPYIHNY